MFYFLLQAVFFVRGHLVANSEKKLCFHSRLDSKLSFHRCRLFFPERMPGFRGNMPAILTFFAAGESCCLPREWTSVCQVFLQRYFSYLKKMRRCLRFFQSRCSEEKASLSSIRRNCKFMKIKYSIQHFKNIPGFLHYLPELNPFGMFYVLQARTSMLLLHWCKANPFLPLADHFLFLVI